MNQEPQPRDDQFQDDQGFQESAPVENNAATTPEPKVAPKAQGNSYKMIALAVVFIGFGIFMLLDPNMMDGATASGRNALFKTLLITVWSMPGGIAALAIGGFLGYRVFASSRGNTVAASAPATSSPSKPALKFSLKGNSSSHAFADKVAPSRRELEARSTKRKELRAKG